MQANQRFTEKREGEQSEGEPCPVCVSYSLFLKEILLLLSVRLDSVLWQKLHQFQRLFDFYQNLVYFTTFDLWEGEKTQKAGGH